MCSSLNFSKRIFLLFESSFLNGADETFIYNLFSLIIKRATMQGFLVLDYLPRSQQALEQIATWVMEGKLQHREDVQEGIENCPQTLNRLFTGENKGKQLLKI